ncbi:hypothetical protein ATCC90586_007987 [Pythium insidiosum]|nr:hypothetical protein ATCC90586_007987 [Pythium insidiosum]
MATAADAAALPPPVLRSPRGSQHGSFAHAPFATEADKAQTYLPWKIAFRVQFHTEKLGLRFHPAQFPDTGNGIYTIRVLEINKHPTGSGPVEQYNSSLKAGQEHLELRPGLYLTHINETHLLSMPCDKIIQAYGIRVPITLRFVDVEAGVVTPHELLDSLRIDPDPAATAGAASPSPAVSPAKAAITAALAPPQEPMFSPTSGSPLYKIILLGTTGVGKSSVLAVGVNGDGAYTERRPATLEAEFGSFEIPDPDLSKPTKIKARIWDTAGQERFRAITRSHYRRADGALLVYDVADPESFDKLGEWLKTLRETAGDSLKSIMVVENKIDQLPDAGSRPSDFVQESVVQAFCKEQGLLFARTSAKMNASAFKWDGQKVSEAISTLLLHIHATALARGVVKTGTGAGGEQATSGTIELKDSTHSGEFTDREALRQGAMTNKEIVAADPLDACAPLTNAADLHGRVALVRRGECNFVRKVWHAQLAGAAGVVVMDDAARSEPPHHIIMQKDENASLLTIPGVFVAYRDGERLMHLMQRAAPWSPVRITANDRGELPKDKTQYRVLKRAVAYIFLVSAVCALSSGLSIISSFLFTRLGNAWRTRVTRRLPVMHYRPGLQRELLEHAAHDAHVLDRIYFDDDVETTSHLGAAFDAHASTSSLEPPESCSICLDDFEVGAALKVLPCQHSFHVECIDPWLETRSGCCPLCKQDAISAFDDVPKSFLGVTLPAIGQILRQEHWVHSFLLMLPASLVSCLIVNSAASIIRSFWP